MKFNLFSSYCSFFTDIAVNAKDSTLTASNTESGNSISISRTNSDTIVYGDTNYLYNYIDDYYSG